MSFRPTLGSMPIPGSFRGEPLVIMLALLALWIGLRASFWSSPIQVAEAAAPVALPIAGVGGIARPTISDHPHEQHGSFAASRLTTASARGASEARSSIASEAAAIRWQWRETTASPELGSDQSHLQSRVPLRARSRTIFGEEVRPRDSQPEQPHPRTPDFSLAAGPVRPSEMRRYSIDGWLFLREGGATDAVDAGAGPLAPSYGRSQFGAVLRSDIGPRTSHLPQAYLRATGAVDSREADLASGASIRPVATLPFRLHGEVRLSRTGEGVELRPAAFVTAGVEEELRPLAARVRFYGQAGYVGGEFATPFADGSLVVERDAKRFARGALAVGAGVWGGAQEGVARLDAGPTASVDLRIGQGRVKLAADYRLRIAGEAEPSSGAALTLSTSF